MKNIGILYGFLAGIVMVLSSCSSSRTLKAPMIGGLTGKAYMEKVIELSPQWKSLSGKVSLTLNTGKTGKAMNVSATFRLMRNESIQFLVAPLLGIEVARMEITPDGILAIDRMGKRYARVTFGELSNRLHTDISSNVLQSLFLNEVFLPGTAELHLSDAKHFVVSLDGKLACIDTKASDLLSYRFFASADQGVLQETRVGVNGTPYLLSWKYDTFQQVNSRLFPQHMRLTAEGTDENMSLDMKFSRLSVGGEWSSHTELSSRYRRIELSELMKLLDK